MRRLNWGCGDHVAEGWINADKQEARHVDLAHDIRDGLPLADDSIDYAVSIHALQELTYHEVVPALAELRRVLKPGGVLRLGLPDLRRAIRAYLLGKEEYFKVDKEEVHSDGGRFIVHALWYGYSRTLFTADFAEELLCRAGFSDVVECPHGITASKYADIVVLDNRREETFFVEATKAPRAEVRDTPYNSSMSKAPSVEVIDAALPKEREHLTGGRIRAVPNPDGTVAIQGWVLGRERKAESVELLSGTEVIGRADVSAARPDIAEKFTETAQAANCGFRLVVRPEGRGESTLLAQAVLDDGTRAPIETVRVKVSKPGFLRRLRG